jgi:hypothetical protein
LDEYKNKAGVGPMDHEAQGMVKPSAPSPDFLFEIEEKRSQRTVYILDWVPFHGTRVEKDAPWIKGALHEWIVFYETEIVIDESTGKGG